MIKNKIAYVCTHTHLTVVLQEGVKTIPFSNTSERNTLVHALEAYNKGETSYETLEKSLMPIRRIELESDSRFEMQDNELFLVGTDKAIPTFLSDRILDFINNKLSVNSLVEFWKSCLKNKYYEAIIELFEFCTVNNLPINENGEVFAYKKLDFVNSVQVPSEFEEIIIDNDNNVIYVDGTKVSAEIADKYLAFVKEANSPQMTNVHKGSNNPIQKIGDTVVWQGSREHDVETSRTQECAGHNGFHIGAFSYSFGGDIRVLVSFKPEHVVAANANLQKLRVWEYTVVSFIDSNKEVKEKLIGSSVKYGDSDNIDYSLIHVLDIDDEIIYAGTSPNFTVGQTYTVEHINLKTNQIMLIDDQGCSNFVDVSEIKEKY